MQKVTKPAPHEEPPPVVESVVINDIVLKVRYAHNEIQGVYRRATTSQQKHNGLVMKNSHVFQLYTLYILNDPVDMSSLTERKVHRPRLFIRKNDKFSPFNFYFLLNLFDIEYKPGKTVGEQFPELWRTTFDTKVTVMVEKLNQTNDGRTPTELSIAGNDARNLGDVFKIICREQKYDERHAAEWKKNFEGKSVMIVCDEWYLFSVFR